MSSSHVRPIMCGEDGGADVVGSWRSMGEQQQEGRVMTSVLLAVEVGEEGAELSERKG